MRNIKYIAVHCTATPQTTSIDSIMNFWKTNLGWKMPGYHFIIKPDGEVAKLLSVDKVSNGVRGFNSETINIAYIGGIDKNGKPIGLTFTLKTGATATTGNITVVLRHLPAKSASGVATGDITNAGGATDASVTFPVKVVN